MYKPPGSGSGSGIVVQVPINEPLPTYDWNAQDEMREFWLLKHQFTSWKKFCNIMSGEVDYLLSILGNEGYLESTLDDEISPYVRVYELEDFKKRSVTIDALIDCVCQLAHHALIGDGSDEVVEFEVQCRLIHAILDGTLSCRRNFSRSVVTRVSHIYWRSAIHTIPLSLELLQCVLPKPSMQYRSPVYLESSHRSIPHSTRITHASTHLDVTIALLKSPSAKVVWRKDIGRPSVIPERTTNLLLNQLKGKHGQCGRKGKKADLVGVHTEEPPCDEIFLADVHASHTNEP